MGSPRLVFKIHGLVIGKSGKSPIDDDLGVGHRFRFFAYVEWGVRRLERALRISTEVYIGQGRREFNRKRRLKETSRNIVSSSGFLVASCSL